MFKQASTNQKGDNSDIVPYWCVPNSDDTAVKIERIVPMYPYSQDKLKYDRLIKILSLYRLTLGQPRQEELIELLSFLREKLGRELGHSLHIFCISTGSAANHIHDEYH